MAFIYKNLDYEKLTNVQMISDVLLTQNKINADVRDILHSAKIIKFWGSTKISTYELLEIFRKALFHEFIDRDESISSLDDVVTAWSSYENFLIPYISNLPFDSNDTNWSLALGNGYVKMSDDNDLADIRTREKYKSYSYYVDKWYNFFMLSLEEKLELLMPDKGTINE